MIKRMELSDPNSCLNRAKDDEFIFVLLERDEAFSAAVSEWARKRVELGKNTWNDPQIRTALYEANQVVLRQIERRRGTSASKTD